VQVLVDGVQVNQPGGSFDFASLGTDEVERIEVVRGPGSALYGSDAVAGVIQVVTRRGRGAPATSATVRGGSFGRLDGSVSLTGGGETASYGFTLSRSTVDGVLDFNNRHEQTVLSGQARLRLDDATEARFSARTSSRTYGFPTDFSGAVVDRNQSTFGDETTMAVEVDRRVGSRVDLRALVTLADLESGTDDAPDGPADTLGFFAYQSLEAMRRTALDLRANARVGDETTLTLGAEFEGQRVRSFSESQSEFGPSTERSEYRRDNRAGYAHLISGRGRLRGNAGVRIEDNDQYGGFSTWQVGASLTLDPATRLRAAAGTGVKEPTFFEAFATGFTVGNPALDPERSRTFEIGIDRTVAEGAVALGATFFQQTLRDLIQYTFASPEPGGPNFFNVAEARSRGLELGAEVTTGSVRWTADWTRLDTEVLDAGFDEGPSATFVEGEALIRRPGDQLRLAAAWRSGGRFSADAGVRVVGDRSDRDFAAFPAQPVTLPRYTLVELGGEARILGVEGRGDRPGLTLFVRVENLFDESHQEVFGFESPGRGLVVGGRMRLGG
jgi:vitamin B12 transporter